MALQRAACLALRRLATAAASHRPALPHAGAAALRPTAAAVSKASFFLQPTTAAVVSLYARRGYAARSGAGRKARAVSEDEEDEEEEFEAMGSDEELDGDFDDDDIEEFDDDDDEDDDDDDAVPKRGRRG
ncbi:phosphopantothenoylcysteine decarboxylase subunit VHS3-like [Phragmites australis]|uniref:phosphopantothenoylcysteine decarboxylase subunit VHS3-like n=1 Tax=Phragmites australis TaxID=29695 RepID=UPI002D77F319|nr:phosphopantothenoylcysteine decarboxylase subunit VHS3-like [Phragmites australis]